LTDPGVGVDHAGNKGTQPDHEDFGFDSDPEPEEGKWNPGKRGDRPQQLKQRVDDRLDALEPAHQDPQGNADDHSQEKAAQDDLQADQGVADQGMSDIGSQQKTEQVGDDVLGRRQKGRRNDPGHRSEGKPSRHKGPNGNNGKGHPPGKLFLFRFSHPFFPLP
jgi:hypothetical protein